MEQIKHLVVGAGLTGSVVAQQIAARKQEPVLVLEKRDHIAGNAYDYVDLATRINVHRYGPHVFHTNDKAVWDYLSQFTEWHYFMYHVLAFIDGQVVNIPFNFTSLRKVFPPALAEKLTIKLLDKFAYGKKISVGDLQKSGDADLAFLGDYVYQKVFLGYNLKQWGLRPEELDPSVIQRVPIYLSTDERYFQDKYQAIPAKGYTAMVDNMLRHPLITVRTKTDFKEAQANLAAENIYYTGSIDEFFDYQLGTLPYRSLDIQIKKYDREYYQEGPQLNFSENYDYTRSCEYKYYLGQKSPQTIVSYEYPCAFAVGKNERFYPVAHEANHQLYQRYLEEKQKQKLDHVHFLGRLGIYRYLNMDQVVAQALAFCAKF
ncbi:MAG: UDP-galactopyranose mutase [Bacteriovoracaceae bacterium]|nr:UDP-galactopyranose mutase [Bacteriovoracaceae bacterium]